MATNYGNGLPIVTHGLVFAFDPKDPNCWDGSSTYAKDLVTGAQGDFQSTITASLDRNGLDFDGVDDYVDFDTYEPACLFGTEYTLEVWGRTDSTPDDGSYAAFFGTGWPMQMYQVADNKVEIYMKTTDGSYYVNAQKTSAVLGADDEYWCYTLTRTDNGDGSSTSSTFTQYINGQQDSTFTRNNSVNRTSDASGIHIGNWFSGHNNYTFGGTIGPVRVYDRKLEASEVLRNYNVQKIRFGV